MSQKIELPVGIGEHIGFVEIDLKHVLCNDVYLPGEYNPHNVRLWLCATTLGNFPLFMGAVWASHEQAALDLLVNEDLASAILVDEKDLAKMSEDEQEELAHLGNAGEACDLTNAGCEEIVFLPARDWELLCKFAEARGKGCDTLDDL